MKRDNSRGRELAENALKNQNPDVPMAAAVALGQMHARESMAKLQHALEDKKIPVVWPRRWRFDRARPARIKPAKKDP